MGAILLVVSPLRHVAQINNEPEVTMATNMDAAVITILQAMLAVAAADGDITNIIREFQQ